jgi:N-acetylglucosaminyldiphosphoundecaprenol N-acetyl-beta-D-mannosaminyltransferase
MIDLGKQNVLGMLVDAVDYEKATQQIIEGARARRPFPVACVPVHSVMDTLFHPDHRYRINHFAMVVPDGMPVRWALGVLHGVRLPDRVRGITLTLDVLAKAESEQLGVFFYGNTRDGLGRLHARLRALFPALRICGMEPSKFRRISPQEKAEVIQRIRASGASMTFVGLGAPLQDIWAYEYAQAISMPIVCVGGAFNVIAGAVSDAPDWMQQHGLEWLYRFAHDPGRLWRRYVLLNPAYLCMVAFQRLGHTFTPDGIRPEIDVSCG